MRDFRREYNYRLPQSVVDLARQRRDQWMDLARRAKRRGDLGDVAERVQRARLANRELIRSKSL